MKRAIKSYYRLFSALLITPHHFLRPLIQTEVFKASSHMTTVVPLLPKANRDLFENLLKKMLPG